MSLSNETGRLLSVPALLLICLPAGGCLSTAPAPVTGQPACSRTRSVEEAFQCARRDANSLRALLLAMPKGGDLHHHLTGAIYPEVLIQLASYQGLCVDVSPDQDGSPNFAFKTCGVTPADQQSAAIPLTALTADCLACPASQAAETCAGKGSIPACCLCSSGTLYDGAVNALSMRGVPWGTLQAHDHFFAIFGKLGPATGNKAALLAQLRQQASRENVLYIETMSSVPYPPGDDPAWQSAWNAFQDLFAAGDSSVGAVFCRQLAEKGPFEPDENGRKVLAAAGAVAEPVAKAMAGEIVDSSELLGCGSQMAASGVPGCEVAVRRQIEMHRTARLVTICQEALLGFAVSQADRQHIVGINIVAAEDAYAARVNYSAHMNLIGNLGRIHPQVGRALHAGELIEGLVPPNDLRFHIHDAVRVAGAQRIGHGVSITYETGSGGILSTMAGKPPVAVEINLVSNAQLLGVQGTEHPLPLYAEQHVPVVLATDDPGIMRTSLTEQFRLAALDYPRFRYADLRTFNRNSLEYSFLTGASIWEDPGSYSSPVADCRAMSGGVNELDLERCEKWAEGQGDKARVQVLFERRLRAFEEGYR
jgi:adenosine deaminase